MIYDADVIIIGAGIAGLACGSLLSKKGLKVLMVEKNGKVGGCCTSFQREGFSFDLSVQSIGECQRGGRIWNLLNELDLVDQIRFIPLEPAREYHFPDGNVRQSSKLETQIESLSRLFPEERKGIERVYGVLKDLFEEFSRIPSSLPWFDPSSFSSRYPLLYESRDRTYGDLLDELISNGRLRTILSVRSSYALLPPEEISLTAMAAIEMSYFNSGVSCVDGKVEELPFLMAGSLRRMGGEILTEKEAERIILDRNRAVGIRLKDGREMSARVIISDIDARTVFFDLLGEDRVPSGFLSKLKGMRPCLSYFILYLGIDGGIDGELDQSPVSNHEIFFDYNLQGEYQALYENRLPDHAPFYLLAPSKVNPSHAPKGRSTLCLSRKVPYHLSSDWGRKIRDELSAELITRASTLIPDLKERILVNLETTPRSIEEWTGNRWGAAYGWAQIPSQSGVHRLQRTTPIPNLYLTGHWTSPGGGISGVVASGELTAESVVAKFDQGGLP